jgi:hypothetical protein
MKISKVAGRHIGSRKGWGKKAVSKVIRNEGKKAARTNG